MATPADATSYSLDDVLAFLTDPGESDLVEIVDLVAQICDTGAAGITILKDGAYHSVVTRGVPATVYPADDSFSRLAMDVRGVFSVEDSHLDTRVAHISWVDGRLARIRFYASAPIYAIDGCMVGRLCIGDQQPKTLTPLQRRSLEAMAASVTQLVDLHLLRRATTATYVTGHQDAAPTIERLAAELSHDLKVPLGSIMASSEMLAEELAQHPDPAVGLLFARIEGSAARMLRMIEQYLGARRTTTTARVDLRAVSLQLAADLAPLLERARATLEIGQLPVVDADVDAMYSVLQNLVTNAVKFARPGVPPRISLASTLVPRGHRISVHDNGIGIPATRRSEVFTMFSRSGVGVAGHGIGLATVARIVQGHGGTVGADEAPGGGAVVWFELPSA